MPNSAAPNIASTPNVAGTILTSIRLPRSARGVTEIGPFVRIAEMRDSDTPGTMSSRFGALLAGVADREC